MVRNPLPSPLRRVLCLRGRENKEKERQNRFTVPRVSGQPQSRKKNAGISELKKVRKLGESLEK